MNAWDPAARRLRDNAGMRRVAVSSRWAAWAFAVALLLKAAVPMFAVAAAQAQGKALVEVCTVYGIATVPLGSDTPTPHPDAGATMVGDHCVLAAAVALGAAPPAATPADDLPRAPDDARPAGVSGIVDSQSAWRARLGHGPPADA